MTYTDEEIERYLGILHKHTERQEPTANHEVENTHFRCWNCQSDRFFVESGYNRCESCGASNGHALGFFDKREYSRFHYRRKSIYQRKYHYEKKINQISKRLYLSDVEEYCLFKKLKEIDQDIISKLNKQFCRKRMISIFYFIKKCLEEMGCEKHNQVYLKISKKTLEKYEKWWKCYKQLTCKQSLDALLDDSSVKSPVDKPS